MSEPISDVAAYFTPTKETFWNWSEDQETVIWNYGATIAFRSELALLLSALVTEGLPPFENVLMVVAACRNQSEVQHLRSTDVLDFRNYPMGSSLTESVSRIVMALESLAQLPKDLRIPTKGKQAILSLVCENGPRRKSPQFSRECVEWLQQELPIKATGKIKPTGDWSIELRGLHDGLLAVNEPAVRLRMETGVELAPTPEAISWVMPAPQPEPMPLTVRQLLHELEQDDEYGGLVRLTLRLIAVMSLPRLLSTPDELQLGGVSDITNRGSFDRLLLSELAHDSDVLMTRVALNEAMYIRREVPPDFPPRQCCVLVDCGIRMWGLPRLYATAVALALAVVQEGQAVPHLYRSSDAGPVPIDVTSRQSFTQDLATLDFRVHPGAPLIQLISETQGVPADFVIVTGEDVLADAEFRRCLAALPLPNCYLVTVTREGQLRVLQRSIRGERVLKQACLDLDQILASPAKIGAKLRDQSIDPRSPAICRVRPFPLLLSPQVKDENCGGYLSHNREDRADYRLLAVTGDRRLVCWTKYGPGAIQYSDLVPAGKLLWHNSPLLAADPIQVLIGYQQQAVLHLMTATPQTANVKTLDLRCKLPIQGVQVHAGIIYVVFQHQTELYSLSTGEHLTIARHRGESSWLNGRFFFIKEASGESGWYALIYDGQQARWDRILGRGDVGGARDVASIFDCQCISAPIAVTTRNAVIATGSKEYLQFNAKPLRSTGYTGMTVSIGAAPGIIPLKLTAVAHDGNRLVLTDPAPAPMTSSGVVTHACHWVVDLPTRIALETPWGNPLRLLHTGTYSLPSAHNVRNKFVSIGVHAGSLALETSKHAITTLTLNTNPDRIQLLVKQIPGCEVTSALSFKEMPSPPGTGYDFKGVQWPDGSRAILDSRGLLHLQSSDPSIPEMTLVLSEDNVAGWCDRNYIWGAPSVTNTYDYRASAATVFREWLIPFCRRLT
ncbi:MAG: hypothetical protein JWN70_3382 [Planctomycetaceae bacterium]|nr:hypothetical protein [Planctomycetaceae bacterium]